MRICSFLPSATEIVCALGLEDALVGVSHECDFPPSVKSKPRVVKTLIETAGRTPAEIDADVSRLMRERGTLYVADEAILRELQPDLVLTQDLCRVCAPSGEDLNALLKRLPKPPTVLSLNPKSVHDVFNTIHQVGQAVHCETEANNLARKLDALQAATKVIAEAQLIWKRRPETIVMEWLDPVFACGHWVPEMVEIAGGVEVLGSKGIDSIRVSWSAVAIAAPEILILSPCGYHLDKVLEQAPLVLDRITWPCRVFAVDADSYFARPGPRIVDGIELLAHLIHPEVFDWKGPADAFKALSP